MQWRLFPLWVSIVRAVEHWWKISCQSLIVYWLWLFSIAFWKIIKSHMTCYNLNLKSFSLLMIGFFDCIFSVNWLANHKQLFIKSQKKKTFLSIIDCLLFVRHFRSVKGASYDFTWICKTKRRAAAAARSHGIGSYLAWVCMQHRWCPWNFQSVLDWKFPISVWQKISHQIFLLTANDKSWLLILTGKNHVAEKTD